MVFEIGMAAEKFIGGLIAWDIYVETDTFRFRTFDSLSYPSSSVETKMSMRFANNPPPSPADPSLTSLSSPLYIPSTRLST